jgi:hypothetical protein
MSVPDKATLSTVIPQGKVAIYNTTFEKHGYNPLPVWVEPPESPTGTAELIGKYPLTLSDFHTSKVNAGSGANYRDPYFL